VIRGRGRSEGEKRVGNSGRKEREGKDAKE